MAVVEFDGIVGLAQRTYLTVAVEIVALLHVLQNLIVVGLLAPDFGNESPKIVFEVKHLLY